MSDAAPRPTAFRLGLFEAIRRTAEAQRAVVEADDLDSFYRLFEARERLLDKVDQIDQELDPVDRARATETLTAIMRLDQATERVLMSRIEQARGELTGLNLGRQAVAAYARTQAVAPSSPASASLPEFR
ncbi:MAG: flagellar protein FliT [Chloroflexota bacterium]|nr:MAG: flagellar protein FliT [Chloroflexota bacterium]